jgi:hypothetical protein
MKPVKIEGLEEFIAEIRTPFYLASLAAERERELAKGKSSRVKKRSKHGLKDETSLDPQRCYERVEPVVEVCLMPKLEETAASKRKGLFRAVLGIRSRPDLKFRNDFYDMQLLRGESLVEPVRKQRIQSSILFDEWAVNAKDEAYGGLYKYDPSAFEPGTTVTLKIRRESNLERWITVTLDAESQREIWDEFAPWREAAAKSGK